MRMPSRITSLHALRGLAALMVAVGHAFYFPFDGTIQIQWFGATLYSAHPNMSPGLELHRITFTGFMPVCAFFLLSGFVLEGSLKRLSAIPFAVNRIMRIYPTFLVAFIAHFALLAAVSPNLPEIGRLISNLFLVGGSEIVPVSWTLLFEMRYYATIALLSIIMPARLRPWVLLVLFAWRGTDTFFWLSFMSIGAVSAQALGAEERSALDKVAIPVFVTGWIYFAFFVFKIPDIYSIPKVEIFLSLAVFWGALAIRSWPITWRPLVFFGDISYPLYCIHLAVVMAAYFYLAGKISTIAIGFVAIAGSILLAWATHVLIERPGITLGRILTKSIPRITLGIASPRIKGSET